MDHESHLLEQDHRDKDRDRHYRRSHSQDHDRLSRDYQDLGRDRGDRDRGWDHDRGVPPSRDHPDKEWERERERDRYRRSYGRGDDRDGARKRPRTPPMGSPKRPHTPHNKEVPLVETPQFGEEFGQEKRQEWEVKRSPGEVQQTWHSPANEEVLIFIIGGKLQIVFETLNNEYNVKLNFLL